MIISIHNSKGGVGKTNLAINLGKALNILNKKVLLIDLDAQANLTQSLGIEEAENTIAETFSRKIDFLPIKKVEINFDLVPASLELSAIEPTMHSNINSFFILKTKLEKLGQSYDYVLIDCPPSLGIFTQNALIASDAVIITVQAQYLALRGLDTVLSLIGSVKERLNDKIKILGLVLTQTNHTRLNKDISCSLRGMFKEKVFKTTIRQNVALAEASANRKTIFEYSPTSFGAIDYMNLAKEIIL
jgi:chromosome partitioning protein